MMGCSEPSNTCGASLSPGWDHPLGYKPGPSSPRHRKETEVRMLWVGMAAFSSHPPPCTQGSGILEAAEPAGSSPGTPLSTSFTERRLLAGFSRTETAGSVSCRTKPLASTRGKAHGEVCTDLPCLALLRFPTRRNSSSYLGCCKAF